MAFLKHTHTKACTFLPLASTQVQKKGFMANKHTFPDSILQSGLKSHLLRGSGIGRQAELERSKEKSLDRAVPNLFYFRAKLGKQTTEITKRQCQRGDQNPKSVAKGGQ